jgi:hypothetical protein
MTGISIHALKRYLDTISNIQDILGSHGCFQSCYFCKDRSPLTRERSIGITLGGIRINEYS